MKEYPAHEYPRNAQMRLSGTEVAVGTCGRENPADASVWLYTDEQAEPVFMAAAEAKLLIAALEAALDELN